MTRVEITYRSNINEMAKLNARLERAEKALAKKRAAAEKAGVADWNNEQYRAFIDSAETKDGWLINKEEIKKNGAYRDLSMAMTEVEDIKAKIEKAEKRLAKAEKEVNEYYEEVEKVVDLKRKEELWELEFEQEKKEWAKDGITLEGRYYGVTPGGKRFWIDRNHGFTVRSLKCFTLYVGEQVIFTSGEFWRAYWELKNR